MTIYTAIFGGRDTLNEPSILTPGARYVCFTDEPFRSDVWEIVRVPVVGGDPRRTSRWYKLLPHRIFETPYSLWVDGSFRITVDVRSLIDRHLGRADIMLFKNPVRDCIYAEAEMCVREGYDRAENVEPQISRYRAAGLPEHNGLCSNGVLLRRHTPAIAALNEAWWQEVKHGSVRDQLSFNYCAWKLGTPFATLPENFRHSAEFTWIDHRVERHRAEFEAAAWSRLPAPQSVSAFPDDLANTALEFGGIYPDGWLRDAAFFTLGQPAAATTLTVRGMVPLIDNAAFSSQVQLLVDGEPVADVRLGLGDFELCVPVPPGGGRRQISLGFSHGQRLPFPDDRLAAALLRFVGFEPDTNGRG